MYQNEPLFFVPISYMNSHFVILRKLFHVTHVLMFKIIIVLIFVKYHLQEKLTNAISIFQNFARSLLITRRCYSSVIRNRISLSIASNIFGLFSWY